MPSACSGRRPRRNVSTEHPSADRAGGDEIGDGRLKLADLPRWLHHRTVREPELAPVDGLHVLDRLHRPDFPSRQRCPAALGGTARTVSGRRYGVVGPVAMLTGATVTSTRIVRSSIHTLVAPFSNRDCSCTR
jgi:hypothetical protein